MYIDIIHAYMTNTIFSSTIAVLRRIFSYFGLPEHVFEFQKFLDDNCIDHTTTAPVYPATNSMAERYVEEFKDKLSKIGDTGEPLQTKLDRFLSHLPL